MDEKHYFEDTRTISRKKYPWIQEVRFLPEIPAVTRDLFLWNCQNLESLPDLKNIDLLDCRDCPELKHFPNLPKNLQFLSCIRCSSLEKIPELPKDFSRSFILADCPKLQLLPRKINAVDFMCNQCPITFIPELASTYRLQCEDSPFLSHIFNLPEGLYYFKCRNCPQLSVLPQLPLSLMEIRCDRHTCIGTINHLISLLDTSDCKDAYDYVISQIKHQAFVKVCKFWKIKDYLPLIQRKFRKCVERRNRDIHRSIDYTLSENQGGVTKDLTNIVKGYLSFKRSRKSKKGKKSK